MPTFRRQHMKRQPWQMQSLQSLFQRQVRQVIFVMTLAVIALASTVGHTQSTTGAISGTVTDSTGAIVVGAGITVVNTATGVTYHSATDNLGSYRVTQLPPGTYTMEISNTGFETQNLQPFKLFVDQQLQQNITLA